jgi:hypothetical protein
MLLAKPANPQILSCTRTTDCTLYNVKPAVPQDQLLPLRPVSRLKPRRIDGLQREYSFSRIRKKIQNDMCAYTRRHLHITSLNKNNLNLYGRQHGII